MQIGEKLRLMRKRAGLSKKELAEGGDISAYYVNKLEEGKSKPSIEVAMRLAKTLNIDLGYFARDVLSDVDIINLGTTPLRLVKLEDLHPRRNSEWELGAPSLDTLKHRILEDLIKTKDWRINLTGESTVYLARIILKLIDKKNVGLIISLSPQAAVVAGALSAVLYDKKESQITSVLTVETAKEEHFEDLSFQHGHGVMLLDEVARTTEPLVRTANEIRKHGGKISTAIAIIDLLTAEERRRILDVLPSYKFVFSADNITSALATERSK